MEEWFEGYVVVGVGFGVVPVEEFFQKSLFITSLEVHGCFH